MAGSSKAPVRRDELGRLQKGSRLNPNGQSGSIPSRFLRHVRERGDHETAWAMLMQTIEHDPGSPAAIAACKIVCDYTLGKPKAGDEEQDMERARFIVREHLRPALDILGVTPEQLAEAMREVAGSDA